MKERHKITNAVVLPAYVFGITAGMVSRWTHQQECFRMQTKTEERRGQTTNRHPRKPQQLRSRKARHVVMEDSNT